MGIKPGFAKRCSLLRVSLSIKIASIKQDFNGLLFIETWGKFIEKVGLAYEVIEGIYS